MRNYLALLIQHLHTLCHACSQPHTDTCQSPPGLAWKISALHRSLRCGSVQANKRTNPLDEKNKNRTQASCVQGWVSLQTRVAVWSQPGFLWEKTWAVFFFFCVQPAPRIPVLPAETSECLSTCRSYSGKSKVLLIRPENQPRAPAAA